MSGPILLYDGVCGLCNRLVQFILRRDAAGLFRFASLQSGLTERILVRHGADARDLNTVYVVLDHEQTDERLLPRSDAVIFILKNLGATDVRAAGQPSATHATRGLAFWRLVDNCSKSCLGGSANGDIAWLRATATGSLGAMR